MHRLEVGKLRLVAGLDERLERRLHEGGHAAAQERLLAEQIGLGLFLECRLEDPGAHVAERTGVGEHAGTRRPAGIAVDGKERRHAAARLVHAAHEMARTLRRDHPDVDPLRRVDPAEVDVEAMGEHQELARPEVRRDLRVVNGLLGRVRHEDHDHVGRADGVGHVGHGEAGVGGQRAALRSGRQAHHDLNPGFVEVPGMGVALAAVADDRDRRAGQSGRIGIVVVVHLRGHRLSASSMDCEPRAMTTAPVRTSSLTP